MSDAQSQEKKKKKISFFGLDILSKDIVLWLAYGGVWTKRTYAIKTKTPHASPSDSSPPSETSSTHKLANASHLQVGTDWTKRSWQSGAFGPPKTSASRLSRSLVVPSLVSRLVFSSRLGLFLFFTLSLATLARLFVHQYILSCYHST